MIKIFICLLLVACANEPIDTPRKKISLKDLYFLFQKNQTAGQVENLWGIPDQKVNNRGGDQTWTFHYSQHEWRPILLFDDKNNLQFGIWRIYDNDPEVRLDVAKSAFGEITWSARKLDTSMPDVIKNEVVYTSSNGRYEVFYSEDVKKVFEIRFKY
ncbi:MAG: hypothetical protein WCG27_02710 [Pseudomonadota bacterium]